MHLTNYAINKSAANFIANTGSDQDDCGHKRSLTFAFSYIEKLGHDVEKLKREMKFNILKTLAMVQPMLSHTYRSCQPDDVSNAMCFEILGFDVMIDEKLKPWILEVNHTPSFTTDSPLDFKIKKNLIHDTIKLLNLSYQRKMK
jgi:tubulin polyglutamylase TTLL6/13